MPCLVLCLTGINRTIEAIRIGRTQRALCAIYFNKGQVMMPDIEAGENRTDSAAGKFHNARDMCRRINGNLRPILRLAGHGAFRKGRLHRCGYTTDWPHHRYERREIIRANIEHGSSAGLIEKIWVRMPVFHSMIQLESRGSDRRPNLSLVNQLNAGLKAAAKKSIRRVAYV